MSDHAELIEAGQKVQRALDEIGLPGPAETCRRLIDALDQITVDYDRRGDELRRSIDAWRHVNAQKEASRREARDIRRELDAECRKSAAYERVIDAATRRGLEAAEASLADSHAMLAELQRRRAEPVRDAGDTDSMAPYEAEPIEWGNPEMPFNPCSCGRRLMVDCHCETPEGYAEVQAEIDAEQAARPKPAEPEHCPIVSTAYGDLPVGTRLRCIGSTWELRDCAGEADTWYCIEGQPGQHPWDRIGDRTSHKGCKKAEIVEPLAHDADGRPLYAGDRVEWEGKTRGMVATIVEPRGTGYLCVRLAATDDHGYDDYIIAATRVRKVHD